MPRSRPRERPVRDFWRTLVAADLELVWKIQGAVQTWPVWMQSNLARVVSHHPLRDVSIITWFAFLLGCHRFGFHFFWASCSNLVGATFLRLLLSAPRPFMYDQRLRPLTDRYETSHGLPSLETHMATVVAGWWAESGGSDSNAGVGGDDGVRPIVRVLAVGYICFVGFTRVYACSRFVHQVALSALTGTIGLAWGWKLSTHLDGLGLMVRHHVRGTAVVVIIALGLIAHHVENNDSQLMGVKKQEYLRVLSDIIAESQQAQSATIGEPGTDENADGAWTLQNGALWKGKMASSSKRRRYLEERRDSFHFLQKAVERRAAEQAAVRPGTNRSRDASHTTREASRKGMLDVDSAFSEDAGGVLREQVEGSRLADAARYFSAAERAWGAALE